ncbi:hypothetical protein D3C76_740310 [compost metagenome]
MIEAGCLSLRIELIGDLQRLGHVHTAAYRQIDVEDRRAMALASRLATQAQIQRQARQAVAGDGLEVMQPGGEGADAVETGGAKHKATEWILVTNDHVQPSVGPAGITLGQRASIG